MSIETKKNIIQHSFDTTENFLNNNFIFSDSDVPTESNNYQLEI